MAKYPFDEHTKVVVVRGANGVADLSAPTLAEINDPDTIDITCYLTVDGLSLGVSSSKITAQPLCSSDETQTPGSTTYDPNFTFYRFNGPGEDVAWDELRFRDEDTVIIRRGIHVDVPFAAGQAVEVYHGQWTKAAVNNSAANTNQTFTVGFAVAAVDDHAVVAAS